MTNSAPPLEIAEDFAERRAAILAEVYSYLLEKRRQRLAKQREAQNGALS